MCPFPIKPTQLFHGTVLCADTNVNLLTCLLKAGIEHRSFKSLVSRVQAQGTATENALLPIFCPVLWTTRFPEISQKFYTVTKAHTVIFVCTGGSLCHCFFWSWCTYAVVSLLFVVSNSTVGSPVRHVSEKTGLLSGNLEPAGIAKPCSLVLLFQSLLVSLLYYWLSQIAWTFRSSLKHVSSRYLPILRFWCTSYSLSSPVSVLSTDIGNVTKFIVHCLLTEGGCAECHH